MSGDVSGDVAGDVAGDVFAALASPVRRDLLRLLLDGAQPAGALAARFDMKRPSVSEHLRVLRDAGLVVERRSGRHRMYELRAEPLRALGEWLTPYERFWRGSLASLRGLLDAERAAGDQVGGERPAGEHRGR